MTETLEVQHRSQKMTFTGSPWQRCGNIVMDRDALKITYHAFGDEHVAYIEAGGLRCIAADRWSLPVPVIRRHTEPDGTVISQKIGHACRSVSGQSLKISTADSVGEIFASWSAFLSVVNRKRKAARLSRLGAGISAMNCENELQGA